MTDVPVALLITVAFASILAAGVLSAGEVAVLRVSRLLAHPTFLLAAPGVPGVDDLAL